MNDGGMGSLRFVGEEGRKFGSIAAEANFRDEDGVAVSVVVILDQHGALYEFDVFKADGSCLRRFPRKEEIEIGRRI